MKKGYKRIISLLLVLLALFTLSSCNINNSTSITNSSQSQTSGEAYVEPWKSGKTVEGVKIKYSLTNDDITKATSDMERASALLKAETDYDTFVKILDEDLQKYVKKLNVAIRSEELLYDLYGKTENQNKSLEFKNAKVEYEEWLNDILHEIYHSGFKTLYYEGMTDQEIEEDIGEDYPERYYELNKLESQLTADFYKLDSTSRGFVSEVDKLYKQMMAVHKELVSYYGYDDYFQYAYDNIYYRNYEISKTDSFLSLALKYVTDEYTKMWGEKEAAVSKLTKSEKEIYNKIIYGDSFTECFNYLDDYFNYFGGFVKEFADGLFCDGGYYYITYEDNGYDGAYQYTLLQDDAPSHPFVLYGKGYHAATYVVHEFGHYMADMTNGSYTSYDGLETQSQANEYLFFEYLTKYANYGFSDNLKKAILYDHYVDSYWTVVLGAVINELEKRCYSKDYEVGDLEKAINDIYNKYPNLKNVYSKEAMLNYTIYVVFESPAYYISYATSMMGALYIDKMAQTNYDAAKEAYRKLIYNVDRDYNITDLYTKCGLGDPFDEETFNYIFSN